jgi:hypothetical protein
MVLILIALVLFVIGAMARATYMSCRYMRGKDAATVAPQSPSAGGGGGASPIQGSPLASNGSGGVELTVKPNAPLSNHKLDTPALVATAQTPVAAARQLDTNGDANEVSKHTAAAWQPSSPHSPMSSSTFEAERSPRKPGLMMADRIDDERVWARSWSDVFRARMLQSLLILGSLVFLKVVTICLQGVNCADIGDDQLEESAGGEVDETTVQGGGSESMRLVSDYNVRCYSGAHRDMGSLLDAVFLGPH